MKANVTIPCQLLKSLFPFVHRTLSESGLLETLKLEDKVIQSIVIDEPVYAITHPYDLLLMNETV